MTYFQEGWDLFICRFLMKKKITDHTNQGDFLIDESHYLEIVLFRSKNPASAYDHALSLIQTLDYRYRDDKGQIVELKCLGINGLDLLQTNLKTLDEELNDSNMNGYTLETISLNEFEKSVEDLIPNKEDLKLFD